MSISRELSALGEAIKQRHGQGEAGSRKSMILGLGTVCGYLPGAAQADQAGPSARGRRHYALRFVGGHRQQACSTCAMTPGAWARRAAASLRTQSKRAPDARGDHDGRGSRDGRMQRCGCVGGPGYWGPNGRYVGWADIGRTCGSPPALRCTAEGPNAGAEDAAELGAKALKPKRPRDQKQGG